MALFQVLVFFESLAPTIISKIFLHEYVLSTGETSRRNKTNSVECEYEQFKQLCDSLLLMNFN